MTDITRREGLGFGAFVAAAALSSAHGAAASAPALVTRVDFKDLKWNRDTFAGMERPLFTNEGFGVVRSPSAEDYGPSLEPGKPCVA